MMSGWGRSLPMLSAVVAVAVAVVATGAEVGGAIVDRSRPGQALSSVPLLEVTASSDPIELHFDAVQIQYPDCLMTTRAFSLGASSVATVPGPLIHVKRGQTLRITVHNDLGPEAPPAAPERDMNGLRHPNTTNIHLHGLHISSARPGDDMSISIAPGESFAYVYDIPGDHAGGLFIWHPHRHGSVALQFGGGAVGLIVVDDDDTNMPDGWIGMLPMQFLLIQHMQPSEVQQFARASGDRLFRFAGSDAEFFLVNGLLAPVITVPVGLWTRFRIAHASAASSLTAAIEGCDMVLVAIDGVYVLKPRPVSELEFLPATRVDIAVRCTAPQARIVDSEHDIVIATIATDPNLKAGMASIVMEDWSWQRPAYLADTSGAALHGKFALHIDLHAFEINRQMFHGFDRSFALHEPVLDSVEEWTWETSSHPMHVHVYHMQLMNDMSTFFRAGDWVDTVKGSGVRARILFDKYDGVAMIHCHNALHSDHGLMGMVFVTRDTESLSLPSNGIRFPATSPKPTAFHSDDISPSAPLQAILTGIAVVVVLIAVH